MRNLLLILLFLSLGINVDGEKQKPLNKAGSVRMMSYNIRNGIGMDGKQDLQRIIQTIEGVTPEVIALQEIDSATERSGYTDVLQRLAESVNMHYTFAPAISFQGGKYGVGLLSTQLPLQYYSVALPGSEEKRVLLVAEFDKYVFCSTHFSLTENDQLTSVNILVDEARKWKKPFFVAGDLNALPQSQVLSTLGKHFKVFNDPSLCTFPATNPTQCIDYIMQYKDNYDEESLAHFWVENEPLASDHRPIGVDVQF